MSTSTMIGTGPSDRATAPRRLPRTRAVQDRAQRLREKAGLLVAALPLPHEGRGPRNCWEAVVTAAIERPGGLPLIEVPKGGLPALASDLCIPPRSLSRNLNTWRKAGLVDLHYGPGGRRLPPLVRIHVPLLAHAVAWLDQALYSVREDDAVRILADALDTLYAPPLGIRCRRCLEHKPTRAFEVTHLPWRCVTCQEALGEQADAMQLRRRVPLNEPVPEASWRLETGAWRRER